MSRPARSELTETGQYTPELVEHALTVYASTGNSKEAARRIKQKFGKGPAAETITKWARDTYNTLYVQIRESEAEQYRKRIAADMEDLITDTMRVHWTALAKAEADIPKLEPRDSPGALRNIATSGGILATNLREMRPKEPIRHELEINADDALRKLAGILGLQAVDGEVVEDAQLAPGESSDPPSEEA